MDAKNNSLNSTPAVKNSRAVAENLRQLAKIGVLNAEALDRGLKVIGHTPDETKWTRFLNILLSLLGSGFLISGIFFFFAFNWASMHRFFKLGLLEMALLATGGLAFWRRLDTLSGKIALGAAALLVGALLAVYGQVYQTGADSYQLFLFWAVLITGWVLISKFTPIWLIWTLLFSLSLIFYWEQIVGTVDSKLFLSLFLLNGSSLLAWEIAHALQIDWLKSRWSPRLLALPTFVALLVPAITLILSSSYERNRDPWLYLSFILFIAVSALVIYIYSLKIIDLFILVVCSFSLIIAFNVWIATLFENSGTLTLLLCLLSGLFTGQAAFVVTRLRRVSQSWEEKRA